MPCHEGGGIRAHGGLVHGCGPEALRVYPQFGAQLEQFGALKGTQPGNGHGGHVLGRAGDDERAGPRERSRQIVASFEQPGNAPAGELEHRFRTVARDQLLRGPGGRVHCRVPFRLQHEDSLTSPPVFRQLRGRGQSGDACSDDRDLSRHDLIVAPHRSHPGSRRGILRLGNRGPAGCRGVTAHTMGSGPVPGTTKPRPTPGSVRGGASRGQRRTSVHRITRSSRAMSAWIRRGCSEPGPGRSGWRPPRCRSWRRTGPASHR